MLSSVGRFLRMAPPAPNAAPSLPAPVLFRAETGRVDWDRTIETFAASVSRMGVPEASQGFGRLVAYLVALVGGEEAIERAAAALLTGDPHVVLAASKEMWSASRNPQTSRWASSLYRPLDPVRATEVDGPAGDGIILLHGLRYAMNSVTEERRFREGNTRGALRRLTQALVIFGEGLLAPEALAVAHGLLDPERARPAPCGLTVLTERRGASLKADYARRGRPVLRAEIKLDVVGRRWVTRLAPAPYARPTDEDYDGAVADLVRRGARLCHDLSSPDAERALARAGFEGDPAPRIGDGAVAALSVRFPAPWY